MGDRVILAGTVGSRAFNMATLDSDIDTTAVFVTPTEELLKLDYDQRERTEVTHGPDVSLYEIGHFLKLAVKGSPNVLELLWLPEHTTKSRFGTELVLMRDIFTTQKAAAGFIGAAQGMARLANSYRTRADQAETEEERHRLEARCRKAARHFYRNLELGRELMRNRRLTLWMSDDQREAAFEWGDLAATDGVAFTKRVKYQFDLYREQQRNMVGKNRLPAEADMDRLNNFLLDVRRCNYNA